MYDMYPEWGPSHLREYDGRGAGQSPRDPRENCDERPDDN